MAVFNSDASRAQMPFASGFPAWGDLRRRRDEVPSDSRGMTTHRHRRGDRQPPPRRSERC